MCSVVPSLAVGGLELRRHPYEDLARDLRAGDGAHCVDAIQGIGEEPKELAACEAVVEEPAKHQRWMRPLGPILSNSGRIDSRAPTISRSGVLMDRAWRTLRRRPSIRKSTIRKRWTSASHSAKQWGPATYFPSSSSESAVFVARSRRSSALWLSRRTACFKILSAP
mmetsp:Transcript_34785/g.96027  ORF Transcript_34785/g.96027 Transcript_34785/m.96027 type:complete len:167 (+) Transcript_34785:904-1404(+)